MDASLTIRTATKSDLDQIAYVWHASAASIEATAAQLPTQYSMRSRINAELDAGWELFLAERVGQIIGMLALKLSANVLEQIFVLPEAQGSGVGAALMAHAKVMMPNGFTLRMAEENRQAADFYERSGLKQFGTGTHPNSGRPVRFYEWKVR